MQGLAGKGVVWLRVAYAGCPMPNDVAIVSVFISTIRSEVFNRPCNVVVVVSCFVRTPKGPSILEDLVHLEGHNFFLSLAQLFPGLA